MIFTKVKTIIFLTFLKVVLSTDICYDNVNTDNLLHGLDINRVSVISGCSMWDAERIYVCGGCPDCNLEECKWNIDKEQDNNLCHPDYGCAVKEKICENNTKCKCINNKATCA
jgi:hypothetical protein